LPCFPSFSGNPRKQDYVSSRRRFRSEADFASESELNLGDTKANAQVAGFLFNSARGGNVGERLQLNTAHLEAAGWNRGSSNMRRIECES
jgi:hypothetical protein